MWHLLEADSANELWIRAVEALRGDSGIHIQPSRAGDTREILHAALTLRNPRNRWVTMRRPAMNPAFALAEVFWILGGRRDAKFLTYFNRSLHQHSGNAACLHGAYGYRLRHHFKFDQLERAFEALRNNPNSRQVVLQIWDAKADLPLADGVPRDSDIPCNTQAILKVRDGKLEWLQVMRSNDIFLGLPHNLVQFTFLQEVLAGWLQIDVGQYHHVSDSLHLYERDQVSIEPATAQLDSATDNFSLPKSDSDAAIAGIVSAVEFMIDEDNTAGQVAELIPKAMLPVAYRNLLCVLVAEALRRRQAFKEADAAIGHCSNPTFSHMWVNWSERLGNHTK